MPWDMVVKARGEEVLVEVISAPREQREELSAEQDEAGLGDLDPIASLNFDQKALLETTQTSHPGLLSAKIWKLLHFYIAKFV